MSFVQHVIKERHKIVLSSVTAAVGFLIALLVNSGVERYRDHEAYLLMRHAIKLEAKANSDVLHTGFLKYYKEGIVLQQFNTAVTTQFLSSPAFLKFSTSAEVSALSTYNRDLALANKYREKAELLSFEGKEKEWLENLEIVWGENLKGCEASIASVVDLP